MNELDKANLIDQTKVRLNETTNMENCFLTQKLIEENHVVKH